MKNNFTIKRLEEWTKLKLGMFIHWGVYSDLGGEWKGERMDYIGEWIMSKYRIPLKEYSEVAKNFNPTNFSAKEIVKFAKDSGFKYIIYTAKHHDGFAMYKSFSSYNIYDYTAFKRDPLMELSEECKKNDIKLCIYYSQSLDWAEENGGGTEENYPSNFGMSWCNNWDFPNNTEKDFSKYFQNKVIPQVTELLTNYGDIYSVWFDCPLTISKVESLELYNLVKKLQPACLINSRLGNDLGDFDSLGDNYIPGKSSNSYTEAIITVNDTWGYKKSDNNWKTTEELITTLAKTLSKGANLVINIGPNGKGEIPKECKKQLESLGKWIEKNKECIYETTYTPFKNDFTWGVADKKDENLYLINLSGNKIGFSGVKNKIKDCILLNGNKQVEYRAYLKNGINFFEATSKAYDVIKVVCENKINIDSDILQSSNYDIVLDAQYCSIIINDIKQEQKNYLVKTDALISDTTKMHIGESGAVENWFNTANYIEWQFKCAYFGKFKVEIISSAIYHSKVWTGGHKVKIECQNNVIESVLKNDGIVDKGCYQLVKSEIGEIELKSEEVVALKISSNEIINDGVGLAILSVRLIKIKEQIC